MTGSDSLLEHSTNLAKKEISFLSLALGFHLVRECGAEVLQPLGILPAAEQYLVHDYEQFASPIGVELTAEVLVGVECHVVLEQRLQKVQERGLACVSFL